MPTDDLNQRVQHSPACVYLYNSEHRSPPVSHVPLGGPGCICNVPAKSDLNQRVQERLDYLDGPLSMLAGLPGSLSEGDGVAWGLYMARVYGFSGPMIRSWRERWGRHRAENVGDACPTCCNCIKNNGVLTCDGPYWPCAEALSVLKEIGIDP